MNGNSVLIVSQRNRPDGFGRQPGYVSFTEAEDVLAACADADLAFIDVDPSQLRMRAWRLAGRTARRAIGVNGAAPLLAAAHPRTATERPLREHYDIAIFIGFTTWDLPLLQGVGDIRRIADKVIVWFPEAWPSEFADPRLRHEPFAIADEIFVGVKATTDELQAVASCPVHHVPPAVDVTRFAAVPLDARRPIDVLGIGRRDPGLHRALLDWSRKRHRLYVYDTIRGTEVPDTPAHRENLGDTYRRTNIAITNYAKYDLPEVIGDLRETPGRLWEGLASGALMVGFAPDEALQRELLGECMVIDLPTNPAAAVELIDELHDVDHSARRQRQVAVALRGHDWIHRWTRIFELAGLPMPDGFDTRGQQLDALAAALETSPLS
ncbi:MAG: hypothetical protein OEV40_12565 [Acidimicrobiia bacterium]|nr:hypothetical protein [Acidimicrobiia bacterium]